MNLFRKSDDGAEVFGKMAENGKCRRRWRLALELLLLLLLAGWGVPTEIRVWHYFAPLRCYRVHELDLTQQPDARKMGEEQGRKFVWELRFLSTFYLSRMLPEPIRATKMAAAKRLFALQEPRFTEELSGMAEAAGVDVEVLMFGNALLDLNSVAPGCRQVMVRPVRTEKGVLHAHNLDWDGLSGIGERAVVVVRAGAAEGRLATVRIAFPGMIGALDIINEKGVALSFNQLGGGVSDPESAVFLELRRIAETSPDFETAASQIVGMSRGAAFCIGLSEGKSGKIAVFERIRQDSEVRRHEPSENRAFLTADNAIRKSGEDKLSDVAVAAAGEIAVPEQVMAIMGDSRVVQGCNLYSVIFDDANNCFYLASGEAPAAEKGVFRKMRLF